VGLTSRKPKYLTRVRAGGVWYLSEMPREEWRRILESSDTQNDVYDAVRETSGARGLVTRKYVAAVEEYTGEARPLHERVDDAVRLLDRTLDALDPETYTPKTLKAAREAVAGAVAVLRVGP
jgi:hypothetical protein